MSEQKEEKTPKFNPSKIIKDLEKFMVNGHSVINKPRQVIPVSPQLDVILGGGLLEGTLCIITGPKKVGKTTTCIDFAATAQSEKYGARDTYFFSVENRLQKRDLLGIPGLDLDKFNVFASTKEKIFHAEDHLDMLLALLHTKPNSVFIVDSVSQLCSKARASSGMARFRDDVPLFLAHLTKLISNILPVQNSILILITHMIADQNPNTRRSYMEASGNKIQYQTDFKLHATHAQPYLEGDMQIGQLINWHCETSAIGMPGSKCQTLLRYGYGIDKEYEVYDLAKDLGILNVVGGGWCDMPDGTKLQGKEKVIAALRENISLRDDIYNQCKISLGLE